MDSSILALMKGGERGGKNVLFRLPDKEEEHTGTGSAQ
jgi:hypothetical protein